MEIDPPFHPSPDVDSKFEVPADHMQFTVEVDCATAYHIKIWLRNNVGLSQQASEMYIPKANPGRYCYSLTYVKASLTADPGVASLIPARSHTFVEIDLEIISSVILLLSAESFKKVCCQLQGKVCARNTG